MSPSPRISPTTARRAAPASPRGEPASVPLTVPGDAGHGWLWSAMDKAAAVAAARLAAGPVLAVAASRAAVLRTVAAGDVVRLHVEQVRYGTASLTLSLAVWVEERGDQAPGEVAAAEYTYIAVDGDGRPRPVLEPVAEACEDPADRSAGDETWAPPT